MSLDRRWRILLLAAVGLAVIGVIGMSRLPYFSASGITMSAPLEEGQTLLIGASWLEARPGDRIELRSAEVMGRAIDAVTSHVYREREGIDGIGAVSDDDAISDVPVRELLDPLGGFSFTVADRHIGVVLEVPGNEAGAVEIQGIRLRYSVNGRWEQEELIDMSATVCVAAPRPVDCGAEEPDA